MVNFTDHTQLMLEFFFTLAYVCQLFHGYCPLVFQDSLVHYTRCSPAKLFLKFSSSSLQLLVSVSAEMACYHFIAGFSWPYSC
ncbi:Os06g0602450 [Oryza sativa Japonica Group]|uniref:Os06g0602450 protein n=1 Tax=Oryza sativa subsp. japonica TaxID=39947 RepID=C7J378_ORYSJ|nr:Os06g0602450 [Oryza sativa Japonica Group]|eukprot:NP_001174888.1 Os06g0602450 [Oryza sativa Japonica Group]